MSINDFLKQENRSFELLLKKIGQLKQWDLLLREYLSYSPTLSGHCHVANFSNHILIILADTPHWATRLRFYVPELLPKFKQCPGLRTLRAIHCRVQPVYAPAVKLKAPLKLSLSAAEEILKASEEVQDERLAEVLRRIASRGTRP